MTKVEITIEIDDEVLANYTDQYLAFAWHLAQHNPAPHGDYFAGVLVEDIGREIIRRWLRAVKPELWHHQGRHNAQRELSRFARYTPGDGYHTGRPGSDESIKAFHSGHWSVRPEAAAALLPAGADVVEAALAWHEARKPGADVLRGVAAEKKLLAAVEAMQTADRPAGAGNTSEAVTEEPSAGDGDQAEGDYDIGVEGQRAAAMDEAAS